jgi:hypothetical protein
MLYGFIEIIGREGGGHMCREAAGPMADRSPRKIE